MVCCNLQRPSVLISLSDWSRWWFLRLECTLPIRPTGVTQHKMATFFHCILMTMSLTRRLIGGKQKYKSSDGGEMLEGAFLPFFVSEDTTASRLSRAGQHVKYVTETGCQAFRAVLPDSLFLSLQVKTKQWRNQGKATVSEELCRGYYHLVYSSFLQSATEEVGSRYTAWANATQFSAFSSYQHLFPHHEAKWTVAMWHEATAACSCEWRSDSFYNMRSEI